MKKRILCLLLALSMLLLSGCGTKALRKKNPAAIVGEWNHSVTVEGETRDDASWVYVLLADGTARLTGYYGVEWDMSLPEKVDGHPVSTLAKDVFADCAGFQTISIPDTLTVLEGNPFDCGFLGMTRITLSESHPSLELRDQVLFDKREQRLICAFGSLGQDYAIPEGTRRVEDHAFRFASVENGTIHIPASVTELGRNPFAFCNPSKDMRSFAIDVAEDNPALEIVDGMLCSKADRRLVCSAAMRSERSSFRIPEGTEIVDDLAFSQSAADVSGNPLETVVFPASVKSVGINPFFCLSNLRECVIEEGNTALEVQNGLLYSKADGRLVCCFQPQQQIQVREGTRIIGERAFNGLRSLQEWQASLPQSLEEIGNYAFAGQSVSCEIPETVNRVGVGAFSGCWALQSDLVFRGDVVLAASAFGTGPYSRGSDVASLTILDADRVLIGPRAFGICRGLDRVSIAAKEARVQGAAFASCEHLREVSLGEGCRTVGESAFQRCGELRSLSLPASVEWIGDGALLNGEEKGYDAVMDMYVSTILCTMTVTVAPGSYAEAYCRENGIPYT